MAKIYPNISLTIILCYKVIVQTDRDRKLSAFKFLTETPLGVASTISSLDYTPQGSLVYYVVDGKNIYFITTKESQIAQNLTSRNNLSLTVFSKTPSLELQIEGTTQFITDKSILSHISHMHHQSTNDSPDSRGWPQSSDSEDFQFVKINVKTFRFSDFQEKEAKIVEGTSEEWA